jgi:release factor glutamine methyltransferase
LEGGPPSRLIAEVTAQLASAGIESARLDAETMLAAASRSTRTAVICGTAKIDALVRERYAAMIARRIRREPLAYILARKEFYSLELEVTLNVLIPRPETETLVHAALEAIAQRSILTICDLGTGSGAMALAIAANAPDAQLTATDISAKALAIARRNAVRLGFLERVLFRRADCFEPMDGMGALGRFDLIVSNPPYIQEEQIAGLAPEISRYEPHVALTGGPDGLSFYRKIASRVAEHLERNASLMVEIDAHQFDAVSEVIRDAGGTAIKMLRDLGGMPRAVIARFE